MANDKKRVREIQEITGWGYQFTQFLLQCHGYASLMRMINAEPAGADWRIVGEKLNYEAIRLRDAGLAASHKQQPSQASKIVEALALLEGKP